MKLYWFSISGAGSTVWLNCFYFYLNKAARLKNDNKVTSRIVRRVYFIIRRKAGGYNHGYTEAAAEGGYSGAADAAKVVIQKWGRGSVGRHWSSGPCYDWSLREGVGARYSILGVEYR